MVVSRLQALAFLAAALLLMLAVLLVPLVQMIVMSLSAESGAPGLGNYETALTGSIFWRVLGNTVVIALQASALATVTGFIAALHLARQTPQRRKFLLILVMLPFWTSILVKSYAFIVLLGDQGLVNWSLSELLGRSVHLPLLFNRTGVMVGMVHQLLPFTVLPALTALLARDQGVERAAAVLGAGPTAIFLKMTLPACYSGILAGFLMGMTLSLGVFVTSAILGGRQDIMVANLIDFYTHETLDWGAASSVSVLLLFLSTIFIASLLWLRRSAQVA